MSSVSIEDAWGESNLLATRPVPIVAQAPSNSHAVAARAAALAEGVKDQLTVKRQEERDIEMIAYLKDTFRAYDAMIYEIKSLRHEHTRRCTMYIAVAGVLFAMLFMYIDRLQQQIRILNSFMIHRQIPTLVGLNH